jgi:hypothetical protein
MVELNEKCLPIEGRLKELVDTAQQGWWISTTRTKGCRQGGTDRIGQAVQVLERPTDVPEESSRLGTSNRASAKGRGESVGIQFGQRRQVGREGQGRRVERRLRRRCGVDVIGARVQAVIAPEDPIAQLGDQVIGDRGL